MDFEKAERIVMEKLQQGLGQNLSYHNVAHTKDVMAAAGYIAESEQLSKRELLLLLTAALFHDTGYLVKAKGHEAESCRIAWEILPTCGYNDGDITLICDMIMATELPQQAHTQLQRILVDADLDYLGRDDFRILGNQLKKEFATLGSVYSQEEWDNIQIGFLENHQYFTAYSQQLRQGKKNEHLQQLKSRFE